MRMKQMIPMLLVLLLGPAGTAVAANDRNGKPAEQGSRSITTESGTEIIIRSEAEKKRRDAENSNRQGMPDSSLGLERAQERRADPANAHSQAEDRAGAEERPWYDPFGWLPTGQDQDKEENNSGWWPFD